VSGSDYLVLYGFAFLIPLLVVLLAAPVAGAVARRLGVIDEPGERKAHLEATPYLGGAAVAVGLVVAGSILGSTTQQAAALGAGAIAIFLLGLVDDVRGLKPTTKVAVEAVVAVALWFGHVRAGFFDIAALDLALTVGWIVVVTNAVNLIDNMDGIASGVTAIASLAYFAIAAPNGDYLVAGFAAALAGASGGFLRHNFPPARIFLGDAGSLLLGFLLASLGLLLDLQVESDLVRIGAQVLILGVPVFDTAFVVVSRLRGRRPVTVGGTDHSSHRLLGAGLSRRQVALVLYGAQAVCCAVAVTIAISW
jgi:UDP-GlcNAc:undecaprenyl-phosphate/decaprenyl-phosphate GlcNAc-1-phosphate transferase